MRIVFVIPYFYDAWAYGGQPRSAYEMAKGLVRKGHSVEVLTTDSGGAQRLSIPDDGFTRVVEGVTIRYYRNLSNTLAFRYRVFLPLRFFREVTQRVRGAEVVHIHELRSFLSVSAASASIRHSVPYVLSPHGGLRHLGRRGLKTIFDFLWGRRILEKAAGLIAISPVEEQDARRMRTPEARIFRIPNSVPSIATDQLPRPGMFRAERRLPQGRMMLFLGRLHAVKGADLLVEAFSAMCRQGDAETHLVLAGPDDGQERELRNMAERLGIQGRVTFTGYLNETQKLQAFVDSQLVVVPSRSEVFAITAVEALMCSRPVLLSSACGLHPMPEEGHGVRSFTTESVEDLTLQLTRALDDTQLLEGAGRGREFVVQEFSGDRIAARLENVYQAIGRGQLTG